MVIGFGWTKNFTLEQVPDLNGKVAVVSGANGGLGLETSRQLALSGAKVFLGVRNHQRGVEAQQLIDADLQQPDKVRHKGGSVVVLPQDVSLDLSDIRKVKAWCDAVKSSTGRLDILVCSAAIIPDKYQLAASPKHELSYSTNHLGHFFLVSQLLPLMLASTNGDARIVVTSSDCTSFIDWMMMSQTKEWLLDHDAEEGWGRTGVYMRTKICNVLFARQLAALLPADRGVRVNSLHPGVFYSDIAFPASHSRQEGESAGIVERVVRGGMQIVGSVAAMNKEQSSLTNMYGATAQEIRDKNYHGEYFTPYGVVSTPKLCKLALDDEAAEELWQLSLKEVRAVFESEGEKVDVFSDL